MGYARFAKFDDQIAVRHLTHFTTTACFLADTDMHWSEKIARLRPC